MANEVAGKAAAPKGAGKKKSNRLVIVFDGRFESLYEKVQAAAKADDRDPDTTVLRIVEGHFNANIN